MANHIQRFIEFLYQDIRAWEEAARFCEEHISLIQESGAAASRTGEQEAAKFRARIAELRNLIDQLKSEP